MRCLLLPARTARGCHVAFKAQSLCRVACVSWKREMPVLTFSLENCAKRVEKRKPTEALLNKDGKMIRAGN